MNRAFSPAQKRYVYLTQGGKCARCGARLGEVWDAHHQVRYADGGVTEVVNAVALCVGCHRAIHGASKMIKPRGWQEEAIVKFEHSRKRAFLVEATPGAGKTIFSGLCAKLLIDRSSVDFCVIVVPTTALKGGKTSGFLGDWNKVGIQVTTVLKDGRGRPSEFRGGVVTYQQLPNLVSTMQSWARNGDRLLFVFDELHHASETNQWGAAVEECGMIAARVLGMTGTPFRGDGKRISFVDYDEDGRAIPDVRYAYREAVRDRVCRPVQFMTDDGLAQFRLLWRLERDPPTRRGKECRRPDGQLQHRRDEPSQGDA